MFPHNVKEDAEFFKRIELEVHQVMAKYSFNERIKKEAHELTGSVGSGPPSLLQATSMVSSADSHFKRVPSKIIDSDSGSSSEHIQILETD